MRVNRGRTGLHVIDARAGERLGRDGCVRSRAGDVIAEPGKAVDMERATAWLKDGTATVPAALAQTVNRLGKQVAKLSKSLTQSGRKLQKLEKGA